MLNLTEIFQDIETGRQTQNNLDRQIEVAHALIELEKPAHTQYILQLIFPSFRIGGTVNGKKTSYFAQVGKNTRLGTRELASKV